MAQREGYLLIDHSASPGIPEDVALQINMDPQLVSEGRMLEAATLTCAHCKGAVIKNPLRQKERAKCPKCSMKFICDMCHFHTTLPDYNHKQFEAKVDEHMEYSARGLTVSSSGKLLLP